ncbi:MAG: diacylglycerol kinase family lipid kinase [Bacteroidales bacterium]|nr:diacylglycerol kinase family lipid kinase [Bacteroidales bacterium]
MKKIRIIINPISGSGKQIRAEKAIKKILDKGLFESEIIYSQRKGHITSLAIEAVEKEYDAVIVVGGDGSLNEAAQGLIGTNTALGIIPIGSGNGLARHLHIPMSLSGAVNRINQFNTRRIDTAKVNEHSFISIAGLGFDAKVADQFSQSKKRGLWNYAKISIREYFRFTNQKYRLILDSYIVDTDTFMIIFANSNQFGNNFVIAPEAKIDDGFLDVCLVKKPKLYEIPGVIINLFEKNIHKSKWLEVRKAKQIKVELKNIALMNIDGEAIQDSGAINITINPLSLSVLI